MEPAQQIGSYITIPVKATKDDAVVAFNLVSATLNGDDVSDDITIEDDIIEGPCIKVNKDPDEGSMLDYNTGDTLEIVIAAVGNETNPKTITIVIE